MPNSNLQPPQVLAEDLPLHLLFPARAQVLAHVLQVLAQVLAAALTLLEPAQAPG